MTIDKLTEIKRLYLEATRETIRRDIVRAIELLISMETEQERERAAVYMDGLAQMRAEWGGSRPARPSRPGDAPRTRKP